MGDRRNLAPTLVRSPSCEQASSGQSSPSPHAPSRRRTRPTATGTCGPSRRRSFKGRHLRLPRMRWSSFTPTSLTARIRAPARWSRRTSCSPLATASRPSATPGSPAPTRACRSRAGRSAPTRRPPTSRSTPASTPAGAPATEPSPRRSARCSFTLLRWCSATTTWPSSSSIASYRDARRPSASRAAPRSTRSSRWSGGDSRRAAPAPIPDSSARASRSR